MTANKELLQALLSVNVDQYFASQLAAEFSAVVAADFMEGLDLASHLLNKDNLIRDWSTLVKPWDTVCDQLSKVNGANPDIAMSKAVASYPIEIQVAVITAVGTVAQGLGNQARKSRPQGKTTQGQSAATKGAAQHLQPIDVNLAKAIRAILEKKGSKEKRKKEAGELLLDWLITKGTFIKTIYNTRHYLYSPGRRLYSFDTAAWHLWLYLLTTVNPASDTFKHLLNDCELACIELGKQTDVVKVAHWDDEHKILRVSRFDGVVYRLDGMTIEEEGNGDGPVIFDDASIWTPYRPDYSAKGNILDWSLISIPHWEDYPREQTLLYRAWWMATFFTELCPTRPVLVMKGGKGGGKSMSLRVLLRLLFGVTADVVGVPVRADSFTALTSNSHIVALDNMDDPVKEIRDKVASLATGKTDQIRRLYTSNESMTIRYRCWLAVTSRTPDTLQRDDLVDRILILNTKRIEDDERTRESHFLMEVLANRNQWWGDVLSALNSVIAVIRKSGIPHRAGLRMEDWASLGQVIAQANGQDSIWGQCLEKTKARQAAFLLDSNIVMEAIEAWLGSTGYTSGFLGTRSLYEVAKAALFGVEHPDKDWPRSVKSFGRELAGMREELREYLALSGVQMRWKAQMGYTLYQFVK